MSARTAPVTLTRVHTTTGRARLRLDRGLPPEDLQALTDQLASVPDVVRVRARPNTGSVIMETAGEPGPVLERIAAGGLVRIKAPPKPPPVGQTMQVGLLKLDADIKAQTADSLDLRTTVALLLLGAAAVQLARGQIAGPATALAIAAFPLLYPGK
jgi:hypothetical protein